MESRSPDLAADSSLSSSFEDTFADGPYQNLSILDGLLHYTGNIINKQFEGEGELQSARETYKGGFKANKYEGQGVWQSTVPDHPSGVVTYSGGWKEGHYDGNGTIEFSNGDRYTGPFSCGAPHGSGGQYEYQDGRVYIGDFCEGLRHGRGRLTQPGGEDFYEGQFDHDLITGEGKASYNNGSRLFEGTWREGHKVYGTMTFPGSERLYTGGWKHDLPDGTNGTMVFANGDRFTGTFTEGKLQGVGHLVYAAPTGKWYYGQFLKDRPHGQGFLYIPADPSSGGEGKLLSGFFDSGALVDPSDTAALSRVQQETADLPPLGGLPDALRRLADPSCVSRSGSSTSSVSDAQQTPPTRSISVGAAAAGVSGAGTPLTPLTASTATCKGWLEKYSIGRSKLAMASNWKRRFFILAPFNEIVCLGYYQDELCDQPIGLLRLNPNTTRIVSFPSPRTHKKATKPGREVCLIYSDKGKTYKLLLRAADVQEHHRWVSALRQCFHTFDVPTDSPLNPSQLPSYIL